MSKHVPVRGSSADADFEADGDALRLTRKLPRLFPVIDTRHTSKTARSDDRAAIAELDYGTSEPALASRAVRCDAIPLVVAVVPMSRDIR